jgi:hypothetical protein
MPNQVPTRVLSRWMKDLELHYHVLQDIWFVHVIPIKLGMWFSQSWAPFMNGAHNLVMDHP